MKSKPAGATLPMESAYGIVLSDIAGLIAAARNAAVRSVNCIMTASYWLIGRRIMEFEQGGETRAQYGEESRLSGDLTARFGRGFSRRNLQDMRLFYQAYPMEQNWQTPSANSPENLLAKSVNVDATEKKQALSANFDIAVLAKRSPLPWSAYVRLLAVKNESARRFYETEALRGGWSVRQLDRLPNKILAAEYRTVLPDEKELAAEIERTRAALERRRIAPRRRGERREKTTKDGK